MIIRSDILPQLVELYRLNLELAYQNRPQEAKREAVAEIAAGYGIYPDRLREIVRVQSRPHRQAHTGPTCRVCGKRIKAGRVISMCSACYTASHTCARCGRRVNANNPGGFCAQCQAGLNDIWRAR